MFLHPNPHYLIMNQIHFLSRVGRVRMCLLTVSLSLIFSIACPAATYHVSTSGSDVHPGTETQPFLTVQKGIDVAQAGDLVLIAPGWYDEVVATKRSGTADAPIVLRGASGSDVMAFTVAHSRLTFEHLSIRGRINFSVTSGYCIVQDCIFNPESTTYPNNIAMAAGGLADKGIRPVGHIIRRNKLLNAKGKGVGVSIAGKNHLIENNYYSSQNGADANWIFANDSIIRGNTFHNWSNPGIAALHTDLFQSWGNNGDVAVGNVIEGNFAVDCSGTQLGNIDNVGDPVRIKDWTWRNNIWIRVSGPLNLYSSGHSFYNNTWVQGPSTHSATVLVRTASKGSANGTKFFNNIFYMCGVNPSNSGHGFYAWIESEGYPLTGLEADYNLVIGKGEGTVKSSSWTAFGSNSNGLNGVDPLLVESSNPTTEAHVRLRKGSRAISAGKDLSEFFSTDFSGRQRLNRWDIGAHQSGGALSAPTGYREPVDGK